MKIQKKKKPLLKKDIISKENVKVMIIHPINKIKKKVGCSKHGRFSFSEKNILSASQLDYSASTESEIEKILHNLSEIWGNIKNNQTIQKDKHLFTMFELYINRLHDLSLQCKLPVMQDFTKSVKIFTEDRNLNTKNHQVIIQAHLDVIHLCFSNQITSANSQQAKDLKLMLDKAIQQNTVENT